MKRCSREVQILARRAVSLAFAVTRTSLGRLTTSIPWRSKDRQPAAGLICEGWRLREAAEIAEHLPS